MSTPELAATQVGGPWFEDLERGQSFEAPALTLTDGHAALHQALCGDRLRLALDAPLCTAVTGREAPLAHPNLVCDVAIGQSTGPTQRVLGNLFYRGLVLERQVHIGDTLRTQTDVVALKENRRKPDAQATGLVVLRIRTIDQEGRPVLDYWRCPMIPLRDPDAATGHAGSFAEIPAELDMEEVAGAVPGDWRLERYRELVGGEHLADVSPGTVYEVEGRDTVTAAPELARLTLNVAMTHTDAGASAHGKRLAYGGHTIAVAAAQATRALPNLLTIVAWRSCEHTGPVFEDDVLSTELTVEAVHPLAAGGLVDLRALTSAERDARGEPNRVLDWRFLGLMA